MQAVRPVLRLLRLREHVTRQLELEEALYRVHPDNWLVLNEGPPSPVVVLGIGGKIDKLINKEEQQRRAMPMFRRFTGGGTVVVDSNSLFVSFIGNSTDFAYGTGPRDLMRWSERFYASVFSQLVPASRLGGVPFGLREHDYVFGAHKFAGNAQGLSRDRFVHHTSFLWDYDSTNMQVLSLPENRPEYRGSRDHDDFLCKLGDVVPSSRGSFFDAVEAVARDRFEVVEADVGEALAAEASPKHTRKANRWEARY